MYFSESENPELYAVAFNSGEKGAFPEIGVAAKEDIYRIFSLYVLGDITVSKDILDFCPLPLTCLPSTSIFSLIKDWDIFVVDRESTTSKTKTFNWAEVTFWLVPVTGGEVAMISPL
ncbi:MAG TPA: hypothetical protein DEA87_02930 [Candidatus Veblenbacteria bacterium]|nr:hypothetical protein [Candidatus Veblenbacteria bacterium]